MDETGEAREPGKVMLVEDDPSLLKVMGYMLQDWGCRVIRCRDGYEALDTLRHIKPDLIISDLDLPFIDGIALFERCREMAGISSVPFVIISAIPDAEERLEGIRDGLAGFYAKPVSMESLRKIVSALFGEGTRQGS